MSSVLTSHTALPKHTTGTPVRFLFELPIPVDMCGSHVSYRFATDEYDISFGVFFQGVDGKVSIDLSDESIHQVRMSAGFAP